MKAHPRKIKAPRRAPGEILRRTDFDYMDGHGTFYQFNKDHFPKNLLKTKWGEHVDVVLYNLHTEQLDRVKFEVLGNFQMGENNVWLRGFVDDIDDCYAIKIEYNLKKPLESHILVYGSARPMPI
ncbi:hypothetical protein IKF87_01885 [Candidatus Saccharibacteria bacterium]|jgi:hypothetical protein|nr:hypothetical protein [Candidatus Saccharibacteria bacterium]